MCSDEQLDETFKINDPIVLQDFNLFWYFANKETALHKLSEEKRKLKITESNRSGPMASIRGSESDETSRMFCGHVNFPKMSGGISVYGGTKSNYHKEGVSYC